MELVVKTFIGRDRFLHVGSGFKGMRRQRVVEGYNRGRKEYSITIFNYLELTETILQVPHPLTRLGASPGSDRGRKRGNLR